MSLILLQVNFFTFTFTKMPKKVKRSCYLKFLQIHSTRPCTSLTYFLIFMSEYPDHLAVVNHDKVHCFKVFIYVFFLEDPLFITHKGRTTLHCFSPTAYHSFLHVKGQFMHYHSFQTIRSTRL